MNFQQFWRAASGLRLSDVASLPLFLGWFAAALFVPAEALAQPEVLTRGWLIAEVLEKNPTAESARQAWQMALAREPQVTALADPMVTYESAPRTIGSDHGYGQVVRLSQRFEWPGKQALRGTITRASAAALKADLEQVRLDLALTASMLFDSHYVAHRAGEINATHTAIVHRLQQSAEAQYAAGRASQHDPLQAEVELALLERQRLSILARQQVLMAQLNGMLHRQPTAEVPTLPASLSAAPEQAYGTDWDVRALAERPELVASTHHIEARQNSVSLAQRAYLPDFTLGGTYNSMWPAPEHQFMLGLSANIPIQLGAKRGAVDEANAALARAKADHAQQLIAVRVELREARIHLVEALAQAKLYTDRILPTARRQVAAAEAGYQSGRDSFSDIMVAERQLRTFEQEYEEALANTWSQQALFNRATGLPPESTTKKGAQ
jgi:outer membrane protein TolC